MSICNKDKRAICRGVENERLLIIQVCVRNKIMDNTRELDVTHWEN